MASISRLLSFFNLTALVAKVFTTKKRERKPHLEQLEVRQVFNTTPGAVILYHYPTNPAVTTDNAQIIKIDPTNNNAQTVLLTFPFPRTGNVLAANSIHDVTVGPGGTVYFSGDPDSTGATYSDGVYKLGTTPGTFSLVTSTVTQRLAVDGQGNLIGISDTSNPNQSTGTASILKINTTTNAVTDLADFHYTRAPYDTSAQITDVAVSPTGTVFFTGNPFGSGFGSLNNGIYQLGTTPGSYTFLSSTPTNAIAVAANGDVLGLQDNVAPGSSGSATILRIDHNSQLQDTIAQFNYTRGLYETNSPFHDVAVAPDNTVYFSADPDGAGGATYTDSVYQVGATPGSFTLIASTNANGLDVVPGITVSGTVFGDGNANGVQDNSEYGISGRTVFLDANNNGTLDAGEVSATTDYNGNFTLANVPPGTYNLRLVANPGEILTTPASGSIPVTVAAGQTAVTGENFGVVRPPEFISLSSNGVPQFTAGAFVGDLTTYDPDQDATFTYTVSDSRFQVVNSQLELKPGQSLNLARGTSFNVTITATNQGGLSVSQPTSLTVLSNTQPNVLVGYQYPAYLGPQGNNAAVVTLDPAAGLAQSSVDLPIPRGMYGFLDANSIHDIAVAPGGAVYIAGDPDSTASTYSDGIYKLGTTPGSLSLISSTVSQRLAVDGSGNLIALVDNSNVNQTTGTASILRINSSNGNSTDLLDLHYTRGMYDNNAQIHDVAAAPDGTIYFSGDPDGSGGNTYVDGIYKVGTTPGTFSLVSATRTDHIAVASNGDIVGLQDNVAPGTTGNAALVQINHTTDNATTLAQFNYSRGLYDTNSTFYDVAAAPDGTIYFSADPDGNEAYNYFPGLYKLGTTPGSFTQISYTQFDSISVIPNSAAGSATISGNVFTDLNANGVQNGGEIGTAGVGVFLDANNNSQLDAGEPSATTDGLGNFSIEGVPPGTYQLRLVPIPGALVTKPNGGSYPLTLTNGQNVTGETFGINRPPTDIQLFGTSVPANTPGAQVGDLTTTDLNFGDSFTYTVSDQRFQVVNGQLLLKPGQSITAAPGTTLNVTITSTNTGGLQFSKQFTLTVANVTQPGTVVGYQYYGGSGGNASILKIDAADGNLQTATDLPFPRGLYGEAPNSVHDIAAAPNGAIYLAGDPDSTASTFSDGIYQVGTTPGSFNLISSTITQRLAVDGSGNLIALVDNSNVNQTTGTASILRINSSNGNSTDLLDLHYTRGMYDNNAQIHDVAAAPDGTIYFSGDPDGSGGNTYVDGIYKVGTTPGTFSLVSATRTDHIAVASNGDIVGLQDNVTPGTTGKAALVQINHTTDASTTRAQFNYTRDLYDTNSTFYDVAVAPNGTIYFAADPDGFDGQAYTDGIYQLGTTPGTFSLVYASRANNLTVIPAGPGPSGLSLSNSSVLEFRPNGTAVGTLSTNETGNHTYTYSLVAGSGSTDNAAFTISGNQLLTADAFDSAAKSSYSIRVRTTDETGMFVEQTFAVSIVQDPSLSRSGTTLTVYGTAGNDLFTFATGGAQDYLTRNGVSLAADTSTVKSVVFLSGGGVDTAYLYAPATGTNTFLATSSYTTLTGTNYLAETVGVQNPAAFSGGGSSTDIAYLYAPATGSNFFVGTSAYAYLQSSNYLNQALGFKTVAGFSGGSSSDLAYLYTPATGTNTFVGTSTYAYTTGTGYSNQVLGFKTAVAFSGGSSTDIAYLYAPASGTNTFVGTATYAYMQGTSYENEALSFKDVAAFAGTNNDTAALYAPASGTNTFVGASTYAYLTGAGYLNQALGYKSVTAFAGTTSDIASLYAPASGSNTFVGAATYAYLTGAGYFNTAYGFKNVAAYSSGGNDFATFVGSTAGANSFVATSTFAYLSGPGGFLDQALGFRNITANAGSSNDIANLYDSSGQATFTGQGATGTLAGPGFQWTVNSFAHVNGYSPQGGLDREIVIGILDYIFTKIGNWQ